MSGVIRWASGVSEVIFNAAGPEAFARVAVGASVYYDAETETVGCVGAASHPCVGRFVRVDSLGRVVVRTIPAEGVLGANGRAVLDVPVNQAELEAAPSTGARALSRRKAGEP